MYSITLPNVLLHTHEGTMNIKLLISPVHHFFIDPVLDDVIGTTLFVPKKANRLNFKTS